MLRGGPGLGDLTPPGDSFCFILASKWDQNEIETKKNKPERAQLLKFNGIGKLIKELAIVSTTKRKINQAGTIYEAKQHRKQIKHIALFPIKGHEENDNVNMDAITFDFNNSNHNSGIK